MITKKWSQTTRYIFLVCVLIGAATLFIAARALLGPLVIASLLAYLLQPGVTLLKSRAKLSHNRSVSLVYALFLAGLLAVLISLVPLITSQAQSLSEDLAKILPRLEEEIQQPIQILDLHISIEPVIDGIQATGSEFFRPERIFRALRGATTNLVWILVILVTAYYLLLDWAQLREWLIHLAPGPYQADLRRLHQDIKLVWRSYFRGQLLLMALVGLISALAATAVGLRNAVLLGLLAGLLDFIPSLGPAIATAVAASVAWLGGSTFLEIPPPWFVILVISLFGAIQVLENVWFQPRIMGQRLRMNRGLVFVAVVGTLALGSALLALIILPLLGSARILGAYLHPFIIGEGSSQEAAPRLDPEIDPSSPRHSGAEAR